MFVSKKFRSFHFEKKTIPVEFAVLHYTAQSLKQSLQIFMNPNSTPVSCHLLIGEEGEIYELVSCWKSAPYKAFHAGKSSFIDSKGKKWENFNHFSLGIEIVNWNGNLFPFKENQYKSLFFTLDHLKKIYPALQNPDRILGHEQIAASRGKKDPGYLFDWEKLFKNVYPECLADEVKLKNWLEKRQSVFKKKQYSSLSFLSQMKGWDDKKARQISLIMEKAYPFWLKKLLYRCLKLLWSFFKI